MAESSPAPSQPNSIEYSHTESHGVSTTTISQSHSSKEQDSHTNSVLSTMASSIVGITFSSPQPPPPPPLCPDGFTMNSEGECVTCSS